MNIHTFPTNQVTREARKSLGETLQTSLKYPVLLMLSGGSSLNLLSDFDETIFGPNLTVTVLDERYSDDPQINNWLQIKNTQFYAKAKVSGVNFIETVPKAQESLDKFALRWEKDLRKWVNLHPKRTIVATIGIGTDGHVAGMSPFPNEADRFIDFLFTSSWVKGYTGNLIPPERITVTAKFMEDKIDTGLVYVVGETKTDALEKIVANQGRMAETPARILREMKQVEVFTDIVID
jgi:6-phosphogluconolactonase/glucosamine-6-phosphate isomerase/deaminase